MALPNQKFQRSGTYKIVLEQYMRQNQLPGLMAVGVRVAKAKAATP
ncbi:gliding motility lipoprotein GldH [Hymenobacter volaticus]|uniref:Gliding motility lipoprotein GldH n=1 Tax=Hymenobacter volaticus TaxID=2932254 RepID=A0ABY4G3W6_9BACT|nr:gliding motility lipoprotein GldH [Hymenobacter volaticus]UOQ65480.1 gliding motility lipoprotein GldH [Hymenobacter volaticus]